MALFLPDHWLRARRAALALAAAVLLPVLAHAAASQEEINLEGHDAQGNLSAGNFSLRDVKVKQGTTAINAKQATASGVDDGGQNSRWEFRGAVHVEYEGAIVDADSAVAIFADGRIKSISVKGAPANFSHLAKGSSSQRNQGRANNIDFDATSQDVHFAGKAWYSDGRNEATTDKLTYNLNNRSWSSSGQGGPDEVFRMTIRPDKPVALPRKPERSTAE